MGHLDADTAHPWLIVVIAGQPRDGIPDDTSMIPRLADDGTSPGAVTKADLQDSYSETDLRIEAQEQAERDHAAYTEHQELSLDQKNLDVSNEDVRRPSSAAAMQDLATQVRKVFDLPAEERLDGHYPAWLLKSVMLQGQLYTTSQNLCFYAYIPRRDDITIKSGFLIKKSRTGPRYHRHWFILKNNILSYYDDASELYFANGNIDLKRAITATADVDISVEGGFGFRLITSDREYYFRADTASAATEWIKILQKLIFRLNNKGDCVKITIPIASILEVEESDILTFARTMKIKIADDADTFAINEYYFSLFSCAKDVLDTVSNRVKESRIMPGSPAVRESSLIKGPSVIDTSKTAPNYHRPEFLDSMTEVIGQQNLEHFAESLIKQSKERHHGSPLAIFRHTSSSIDAPDEEMRHTSLEHLQEQAAERNNEQHKISQPKTNSISFGSRLKNVGHMAASVIHTPLNLFSSKETSEVDPGAEDQAAAENFRKHFGLSEHERLLKIYRAFYFRGVPLTGSLYLGDSHLCFRSSTTGAKLRILLPLEDVEIAKEEGAFRFGFSGLTLNIKAHVDMYFEFSRASERNQCIDFINGALENLQALNKLRNSEKGEVEQRIEDTRKEHAALERARKAAGGPVDRQGPPSENVVDVPAIIFDSPNASMVSFRPPKPLRFTCLTIGSRGDVQPYVALCKGLIADGQKAKIATHEEFRGFVESHGIEFVPIDGNPAELMAICVEHGMFTYSFLKEASQKFRGWIDDLLKSSWKACQNSDVLIESPSAMGGIHIAEALGIPYYRAFTMPWSKTRTYPHAFAVPDHDMGGNYNAFTYSAFDTLFWKGISGQVNRWRKKSLNLPSTSFDKLSQHKVPFLYNFSPSVVPPANDWHEWIRVTGYWFLDGSDDDGAEGGKKWKPPEKVVNFINKAREDQKKLVYIGFGSIVVSDPKALTKAVVDAVRQSDVRCILVKGWSARSKNSSSGDGKESGNDTNSKNHKTSDEDESEQNAGNKTEQYGEEILSLDSIPHDWLFPQLDAVCHHGGAGSVGASLRAGVPTIVKPFFGDQYFYGDRVRDLGVGVCLKKLTVKGLKEALQTCTSDTLTIQKANKIGAQIRSEKGVENAIENIYRDLEYARSLIAYPERAISGESSEESWTEIDAAEDASDAEDDADLFESTTDANGHKVSILKPFKNLKLPNPLGDRSGSYGLSGIKLFKGRGEAYKLRKRLTD